MPESPMESIYTGSVKTVHRDARNPNVNYFEFSDDYSVFDWGKMPDKIEGKGKALALIGTHFFQELSQPINWQALSKADTLHRFDKDLLNRLFKSLTCRKLAESGLLHNFEGLVDRHARPITKEDVTLPETQPLMRVRSVEIPRPRTFVVDQQTIYQYETNNTSGRIRPTLVPLEVIFRFGMPEGSSLKKRLSADPMYYTTLGLTTPPEENVIFERPVIEFFTKLEPEDRFLSPQEAFMISGLTEHQFKALYETTLLVALWLFDVFSYKRIQLWDGKFEFAISEDGLMLVDSIGPDELRLKAEGVHLSKEVIRQFYRGDAWEEAVKKAKAMAASRPGVDWKQICREELGQEPRPLSAQEKHLVENLYAALTNRVMDQEAVPAEMAFDEVVSALQEQQPAGVC